MYLLYSWWHTQVYLWHIPSSFVALKFVCCLVCQWYRQCGVCDLSGGLQFLWCSYSEVGESFSILFVPYYHCHVTTEISFLPVVWYYLGIRKSMSRVISGTLLVSSSLSLPKPTCFEFCPLKGFRLHWYSRSPDPLAIITSGDVLHHTCASVIVLALYFCGMCTYN